MFGCKLYGSYENNNMQRFNKKIKTPHLLIKGAILTIVIKISVFIEIKFSINGDGLILFGNAKYGDN